MTQQVRVFKQPAVQHKDYPDHEGDPKPPAPPTESVSTVDDDEYDALLDEIDGVLETNAEQFVKDYKQQSGQ